MRTFDSTTEQNILRVVQEEVVPALGCTEPISLALASATARYYLGKMPERIEAKVSPNLMKNGMGVTVPNTGTVGLPMAAAIGAIGGDHQAGLEVLKNISTEQVAQAKQMMSQNLVNVAIFDTKHILYSEATLFSENESVTVRIAAHHTNVIYIEKNSEVLFSVPCLVDSGNAPCVFSELTAKDMFDFSMSTSSSLRMLFGTDMRL